MQLAADSLGVVVRAVIAVQLRLCVTRRCRQIPVITERPKDAFTFHDLRDREGEIWSHRCDSECWHRRGVCRSTGERR